MTIAIDKWAAEQGGEQPIAGSDYVSEDELSGAGDLHGDAGAYEEQLGGHTGEDAGAASAGAPSESSAEDEALRAKRAKDKRTMMIAGGVLAVLGVVFAVSLVLRPHPQQQVARAEPRMPMDAGAPPSPSAAAPVVAMAPPPGTPAVAPVDFGQPTPQAASGASAPVSTSPVGQSGPPLAPAGPAAAVTSPSPAAIAAAPTAGPAPGTLGAAPSPAIAGGARAPAAPSYNSAPAGQSGPAMQVEIDHLRDEVASVRKELQETVAALRKEVDAAHGAQPKDATRHQEAAARPARPKHEKAFVGITEKPDRPKKAAPAKGADASEKYTQIPSPVISETKTTPTAPPPAAKGGKVRNDSTVYAISNGRAWVHWSGDGENHMVGLNSVLPDNSRVTKLDDVNGIVFTTAGEIHVKPAK